MNNYHWNIRTLIWYDIILDYTRSSSQQQLLQFHWKVIWRFYRNCNLLLLVPPCLLLFIFKFRFRCLSCCKSPMQFTIWLLENLLNVKIIWICTHIVIWIFVDHFYSWCVVRSDTSSHLSLNATLFTKVIALLTGNIIINLNQMVLSLFCFHVEIDTCDVACLIDTLSFADGIFLF